MNILKLFRRFLTKKAKTIIQVKKPGALGYIPNEDTIKEMSDEDQKLYFETKRKIESANDEYHLGILPLTEFLNKFDGIENDYSFAQMCELWSFLASVAYLGKYKLNLEFNG